jgi:chitinase
MCRLSASRRVGKRDHDRALAPDGTHANRTERCERRVGGASGAHVAVMPAAPRFSSAPRAPTWSIGRAVRPPTDTDVGQMGHDEHDEQGDREVPIMPSPSAPARRRRLSATRVVLALALMGALVALGLSDVPATLVPRAEGAVAEDDAWFAPYVDVTLTPTFRFEDPEVNPLDDLVLAFVVADPADGCTPSWGATYGLDDAATAIDLDRRIERVRDRGGDVIVSFGGQRNDELAVACDDGDALVAAYRSVIDRYGLSTIDLDIEGDALGDVAANERRADALAVLQAEYRAQDRPLAVWLTVPVSPQGLDAAGVALVDTNLEAGVDVAGVNLMTMDYGASRDPSVAMADATEDAIVAAHRQLDGAYRRADQRLDAAQLWHKLGATPMIGQNDTPLDVFQLEDAAALLDLVDDRGLGRVSLWSLNRDGACGPNVDISRVSNFCTGLVQEPLAFSAAFGVLPGRFGGVAHLETTIDTSPIPVDDPAHSPYPIWDDVHGFDAGDKVVWHGNVYEAKWWNIASPPDAPVVNEWDTPWSLVGPVLPTDVPATTTTVPRGTYPEWDDEAEYEVGDRVQLDGIGYEAKWYTQGFPPDTDVPNDWDTPWAPIEG